MSDDLIARVEQLRGLLDIVKGDTAEDEGYLAQARECVHDLLARVQALEAEHEKDMKMAEVTLNLAKSSEHFREAAETHLQSLTEGIEQVIRQMDVCGLDDWAQRLSSLLTRGQS